MRGWTFQFLGTNATPAIRPSGCRGFSFVVFRGHRVQEALAVGTREFERASFEAAERWCLWASMHSPFDGVSFETALMFN